MGVFAGTARRFLRASWIELLIIAFIVLVGVAAQKDGLVFVLVEGVFGAGVWMAGRRHRQTPLHRKVDRIDGNVAEVRGTMEAVHAMLAEQEAQDGEDESVLSRPPLYVVPS